MFSVINLSCYPYISSYTSNQTSDICDTSDTLHPTASGHCGAGQVTYVIHLMRYIRKQQGIVVRRIAASCPPLGVCNKHRYPTLGLSPPHHTRPSAYTTLLSISSAPHHTYPALFDLLAGDSPLSSLSAHHPWQPKSTHGNRSPPKATQARPSPPKPTQGNACQLKPTQANPCQPMPTQANPCQPKATRGNPR